MTYDRECAALDVERRHIVGIGLMMAANAMKDSLAGAIVFVDQSETRTFQAAIHRWHRHQPAVAPGQLVVELAPALYPQPWAKMLRFRPALIRTFLPGSSSLPFADFAHVRYPQIFDAKRRVVIADDCRPFMQIVLARIGNLDRQPRELSLCLLPVAADFHLTAQRALQLAQLIGIACQAFQRLDNHAAGKRHQPLDVHVDAVGGSRRRTGCSISRCV